MIILINKYHRTEAGETVSTVKVEKPTEVECYREAQKQAYQMCANYMADASVIDWAVSLYNPRTMRVEHPESYFTPAVPVEPEQVEEVAEPAEMTEESVLIE